MRSIFEVFIEFVTTLLLLFMFWFPWDLSLSKPGFSGGASGKEPTCQFMRFSRQEYWSGLPCPAPGDLPNTGIEALSLMSPELAGGFFTTTATGEAPTFSSEKIANTKNLQ